MCGIAGIIDSNQNKSVTINELKMMSDSMFSRGPDDEGLFINKRKNVGFGFRRLSIIDIKLGHQPMSDFDNNIWIVFNGEIYNYQNLREILIKKGHRFNTNSDTEVIIYAYKEWGEDCVHKFRGMFAFAIWDKIENKLFLARDRLGIKPLYFVKQESRLIFSSEIKAIHKVIHRSETSLDEEAFYHYLTLSVTPAPLTMFKNIQKLRPGHTLTTTLNNDFKIKKYWDPKNYNSLECELDEESIINNLKILIDESIKLRMVSDVPFGAFLSGGIDSSLNVALMDKNMEKHVDTFSVAIKNDSLSDERSEAQRVSSYFNTNHKEIEISSKDFIKILPKIVKYQDEPLADPVCIPLYYVSKLARENGTYVIQVGEGADEIFAGYELYGFYNDFNKYYRAYSNFPSFLKATISRISRYLLPVGKNRYVEYANENKELFWGGAISFYENEKINILKKSFSYNTYDSIISKIYSNYDNANYNYDFIDRTIFLELQHRLPELLLMRVDKMGMANSIETRVPYLDHKLVEFALSIPSSLKYKNGVNKHILKEAARGIIPDSIIDKKKKGFCGSASNMVTEQLVDYAENLFSDSDFFNNYFDKKLIDDLLKQHSSNKKDNGVKIWTILNLVQWHKEWIE